MSFLVVWTEDADRDFRALQQAAEASLVNRHKHKKAKASKAVGLFKQVYKSI